MLPDRFKALLKRLLAIAKLVFTPIAISCLLYFAWDAREKLQDLAQGLLPVWLFFSLFCWMALHLISPLFTRLLFRAVSNDIGYQQAFIIHSRRLPAKYLPGGIWHTVARATDYHSYGFAKREIGFYLLMENLLAAIVTLGLGGLVVSFMEGPGGSWRLLVYLITAFCALLCAVLPMIIRRFFLQGQSAASAKYIYQSLVCLLFYWLVAALSFICFIKAIPGLELAVSLFEAGGVYIFSWGVGFITLFAPQGIGVSEFVSAKLLNAGLTAESFVVVLASFRFISLAGDICIWLFSLVFRPQQ